MPADYVEYAGDMRKVFLETKLSTSDYAAMGTSHWEAIAKLFFQISFTYAFSHQ